MAATRTKALLEGPPAVGDLGVDGVVHPPRGEHRGHREVEAGGVARHRGGVAAAGLAGVEVRSQLLQLALGQAEVELGGGEPEGAIVEVAVGRAHGRPSAAPRSSRSWTRARHISVRVAPSVFPQRLRDLVAAEALRGEEQRGAGVGLQAVESRVDLGVALVPHDLALGPLGLAAVEQAGHEPRPRSRTAAAG